MAYVVARPGGRYEFRESRSTSSGPRSRTLASCRELTPDVVRKVADRARGTLSFAEVERLAARAGVHVVRSPADRAAAELLRALDGGAELSPTVARVLADRIGGGAGRAPVSDAERSAAGWLAETPASRGEALRDLLLLGDRLPARRREPVSAFPGIRTTA